MWGRDIYISMPYLCAHQKAQREPDPDLHTQFALHVRSQLGGPDCLPGEGEGEAGGGPTFGHRYLDISLIMPQSALRCSCVVSSASASRDAFWPSFGAAAATTLFRPSTGLCFGPLFCCSADAADANPRPRAVRMRLGSSDGQRRRAPRAVGRRMQAESIW